MRKLIRVQYKHIKKGCYRDAGNCPVSLAILEQTGLKPLVTTEVIRLVTPEPFSIKNIQTPRSVTRFINKFDHNKEVKPFNFYLEGVE